MCSVTPAFCANALKNSRNSSLSSSPTLFARERHLPDEVRPPGNVDRGARHRLVHRQMHVGVAGDALHVAERLLQRGAERDADVLDRVVLVDVEVALGLDGDVDQAVAGDLLQHVVEEADAGRESGPCPSRRDRR